MPLIKKLTIVIFLATFSNCLNAEEVKKLGKHKDWETYVINGASGKVCFAQSNQFYKLQRITQEKRDYSLVSDQVKI